MTETLPKRRLKNFDFSGEGAHVALISKEQGGAANGWHTAIITKATKDVTTDYLQKATMVNVTLPFDDLLERFFGIWLGSSTSEPALRQALLGRRSL